MSTRCAFHFKYPGGPVVANIYRHYDGNPDTARKDLTEFFDAVEAQTTDTRFDEPAYLAAKFVVWQAWEYAKSTAEMANLLAKVDGKPTRDTVAPLSFTGVGVDVQDAGDLAYIHTITCSGQGRPAIISEEA